MSKYTDMVDYYNRRIEDVEKDNRFWRDRCSVIACNQRELESRIDTYKEILSKLLGEKCTTTDSIFMFEGKVYRPVEFTLNRNEDSRDTLTVEFVKADVQLEG